MNAYPHTHSCTTDFQDQNEGTANADIEQESAPPLRPRPAPVDTQTQVCWVNLWVSGWVRTHTRICTLAGHRRLFFSPFGWRLLLSDDHADDRRYPSTTSI